MTVTMNGDRTVQANFRYIHAPIATGKQVVNRNFAQAEYINTLTWQTNPSMLTIANIGLCDEQVHDHPAVGWAGRDDLQHRNAGRAATSRSGRRERPRGRRFGHDSVKGEHDENHALICISGASRPGRQQPLRQPRRPR
jgi:hypothetical protein